MTEVGKIEKEIEIKFPIDENILSKIKNIEMSSYEELDEYFFTPETLKNDTYLRFRRKKGKIFLNLKDITAGETPDCYEADEMSIELTEEQYLRMKRIFDIIFPIKWTVKKTRRKGHLNGCEILRDSVDGLGDFLEIEGPKEKILEVCRQFDLDIEKRDKGRGYVRMGMRKAGLI